MQHAALSADLSWQPLLTGRHTATVESVFRHALNLSVPGYPQLFTVFPQGSPASPSGLVASHTPAHTLASMGDMVHIAEGSLEFPHGTIHTTNCQFVSNRLHKASRAANLPLAWLAEELQQRALPGSFYGPLADDTFNAAQSNRLAHTREQLVQSAVANDTPGIARSIRDLVGLGIGLTPSGDDYLVGLLLVATGQPHPHTLREILVSELPPLLPRTTRVSQQYLAAALEGRFSEPLRQLYSAMHTAQLPALRQALGTVYAHGATSGQDTATGMYDAWTILHQKENELS